MKLQATGEILSLTDAKQPKSNNKTFLWGTARITGKQGNGQIVTITRTKEDDDMNLKPEVKVGQIVTLHADSANILTDKNGKRFIAFEVQASQLTTSLKDTLSAFGVKEDVLQEVEVIA